MISAGGKLANVADLERGRVGLIQAPVS